MARLEETGTEHQKINQAPSASLSLPLSLRGGDVVTPLPSSSLFRPFGKTVGDQFTPLSATRLQPPGGYRFPGLYKAF